MRKIQKAGKIHQHYKMKILLNAKVKYYKSGITNILSLREAGNKFPLIISFTFLFYLSCVLCLLARLAF